MTTDYSRGWAPPTTVENFKQQFETNDDSLYAYMNGHLNRYRTERDTVQGQLMAARQVIESLEEQNNQLSLDLNIAKAGHSSTSSNSAAAARDSASTFRSEKFPDPEKFDGTRSILPGFITQLRMKLEVNNDRFRDESAKVIYSISRLEGQALDQIVPLVNTNPEKPFTSVTAFLSYLEASFGDPDPRGTARRELTTLKQGAGDFASYYSKFLRVISYLEYNEAAKIDALEKGLSEDLNGAMSHRVETPVILEDYAILLMRIDNQIWGRKAEQKYTRDFPKYLTDKHLAHPSHVPGGLTPMDLSAMHSSTTTRPSLDKRYVFVNGSRKLSAGEKQWRRDNFLCMYCAGAGHGSDKCPSAKHPRNQASITGAVLRTTLPTHQSVRAEGTESESGFQ